jgi:L-amino acid N-acyltransferase YncA
MASCYGSISCTLAKPLDALATLSFPLEYSIKPTSILEDCHKSHSIWIHPVKDITGNATVVSRHVLEQVRAMLNTVIREGRTYPQERPLSFDEFLDYFLSGQAFVATLQPQNEGNDDLPPIVGAFYIKPNFPGRCNHICNGGFLTLPSVEGHGIGQAMGKAYLRIAPLLGYRASLFNLVFVDNEPSVRIWRKLGFIELARLPKAGKIRKGIGKEKKKDTAKTTKEDESEEFEYIDALQFYYSFV